MSVENQPRRENQNGFVRPDYAKMMNFDLMLQAHPDIKYSRLDHTHKCLRESGYLLNPLSFNELMHQDFAYTKMDSLIQSRNANMEAGLVILREDKDLRVFNDHSSIHINTVRDLAINLYRESCLHAQNHDGESYPKDLDLEKVFSLLSNYDEKYTLDRIVEQVGEEYR